MFSVFARGFSTFADDLPLFAQPFLCPSPIVEGPELHDRGLDLRPCPAIYPRPPCQLHVIIRQRTAWRPPRHHKQHQVRAGLLGGEVACVRNECVSEEREVWEFAHAAPLSLSRKVALARLADSSSQPRTLS